MLEPRALDAGEIADEGYVHQRVVLDRRAELVATLSTEPPPASVVQSARN